MFERLTPVLPLFFVIVDDQNRCAGGQMVDDYAMVREGLRCALDGYRFSLVIPTR
jgi:hypothetical protein